jgi:hypothetical protein
MAIKRIQRDNSLELHVGGIDGWDDFEILAKYLQKSFGAIIKERLDGICSRTWKLEIAGEEITLKHHDDLGNYLVFSSRESETMLQIISDLDRRLA